MKLKFLPEDEFERRRVLENLQVGLVAAVWVILFASLLIYGAMKERKPLSERKYRFQLSRFLEAERAAACRQSVGEKKTNCGE